jgi:hypothetical protein
VIVDFGVGQIPLFFSLCNQGFKSGLLMHSVGHAEPAWVWQKIAGEYNGLGPLAPMASAGKSQLQPAVIEANLSNENHCLRCPKPNSPHTEPSQRWQLAVDPHGVVAKSVTASIIIAHC